MDLEAIRLFLAVAQHGAFNAAADSLRVSRSTLRRRVDALEARAGIPLLARTPHGIHLTEAGKVLNDRGRALLEGASALLDSIREVGDEPTGVLRMVLPVGSPPHVLSEIFMGFRQAYPKLRFESRFSEAPLSEALTDVDMAVHFDERPPKGPWISAPLFAMPLQLRASEAYLSRRGTPQRLQDLAGHDLLVWHPPQSPWNHLPLLGGGQVPVEPILASTDAPALWYTCISGAGLAYLPMLDMEDPLGPPRPDRAVLQEVIGSQCVLRVSVPEALADIPKIRLVLEWTRQFLSARAQLNCDLVARCSPSEPPE